LGLSRKSYVRRRFSHDKTRLMIRPIELISNVYTEKFQTASKLKRKQARKYKFECFLWGAGGSTFLVLLLFTITGSFPVFELKLPGSILLIFQWLLCCFVGYLVYYNLDKGKAKRGSVYKNAEKDFIRIKELLKTQQRFVLYLRDFESGRGLSEYTSGFNKFSDGSSYSGSRRFQKISKLISKHFPVVSLNNEINEDTPAYNSLVLHCDNENWIQNIKILMDAVYFIVFDYSLMQMSKSDNIKLELQYGVSLRKKVVIVGNDDELSLIINTFGLSQENLLCHICSRTLHHEGPYHSRHLTTFFSIPDYFKKALEILRTYPGSHFYSFSIEYDRESYRYLVCHTPMHSATDHFLLIANKNIVVIKRDLTAKNMSQELGHTFNLEFVEGSHKIESRRLRELILEHVESIALEYIDKCP
jgi:hypothetical protein